MGGCCSKDPDAKRSWSPEETKNGSTASTVVAQPIDDATNGTFTTKATIVLTTPPETITTTTTTTTEN